MKKMSSSTGRISRISSHLWPVLVWLAALGGVIALFQNRSQRFEVLGIVQGRMHPVAAPMDGRLQILSVELFEDVYKGQTLAVLDHSQLDAQIAAIQAEIEHLTAQLPAMEDTMLAEAANLQTETMMSQRRLYADVENARLRLLDQKLQMETDKITLEDLAMDVKAARQLKETDAIAPYDLQKSEALYEALSRKIEQNQDLLTQAEQELETARKACDSLAQRQPVHPSVTNALELIRRQITVQEKLMEDLTIQREMMKLTSPVDGRVVQIQFRADQAAQRRQGEDVMRKPGEVVLAGDPILVVAELEPTEIVAYIGQEHIGRVQEQMTVQLVKNTEPAQIANSQVVRLGPSMELAPPQLWRNPAVAQWGLPVLIKIPPGLKLLPGETIGVRGL